MDLNKVSEVLKSIVKDVKCHNCHLFRECQQSETEKGLCVEAFEEVLDLIKMY